MLCIIHDCRRLAIYDAFLLLCCSCVYEFGSHTGFMLATALQCFVQLFLVAILEV